MRQYMKYRIFLLIMLLFFSLEIIFIENSKKHIAENKKNIEIYNDEVRSINSRKEKKEKDDIVNIVSIEEKFPEFTIKDMKNNGERTTVNVDFNLRKNEIANYIEYLSTEYKTCNILRIDIKILEENIATGTMTLEFENGI